MSQSLERTTERVVPPQRSPVAPVGRPTVSRPEPAAAPSRAGQGITRYLVVLGLLDALAIIGATVFAANNRELLTFVVEASPVDLLVPHARPWIVASWLFMLFVCRAYDRRLVGAGGDEFRGVLHASMLTAGLIGLFCYLAQFELSRGFLLLLFAAGIPLLLTERFAARKVLHMLRSRGRLVHRVVLVGGSSGIKEVVDALARVPEAGYEVVGACLPGDKTNGELPVPVLGTSREIRRICERVGADIVLVTRGGYDSSEELRRVAWQLQGSDYDLVVVPSLTDVAGPRISMKPVGGLPLLHVDEPQADEAVRLPKRLFDVVMSVAILLVLSPVMISAALAVKLHGGPVLFRQARVGREGKTFYMLKFRSMVVDAEARLDELRGKNEFDGGVLFKIREDPRVTRIGRFMRRFSIDELPQLFNVLKGEMSLVGPRPPLPTEVALYDTDMHRRLLVRPGVTGLWQVSGRSSLTWDESVRLDLYYVDNWSMTSDVVIMLRTLRAVLGSSGAH